MKEIPGVTQQAFLDIDGEVTEGALLPDTHLGVVLPPFEAAEQS